MVQSRFTERALGKFVHDNTVVNIVCWNNVLRVRMLDIKEFWVSPSVVCTKKNIRWSQFLCRQVPVLLEKCFYEAGTRLFLGPGTQRRLMFPVNLADILELNKDTILVGLSNTPKIPLRSLNHLFNIHFIQWCLHFQSFIFYLFFWSCNQ
jgi:hypothetical protein